MKSSHVLPLSVLISLPFLLPSASASDPALPGSDERTTVGKTRDEPLLSWADFDRDGFVDVVAIHPNGVAAFYRGTRNGSLALVTEDLGLSALPALRATAWQDVDADGYPDLLVLLAGGGARLLRNDGRAFSDGTLDSGLELEGALAASWNDHDNDGRPDLVTRNPDGYRVHRNLGDGLFESRALESPIRFELGAEVLPSAPRVVMGTGANTGAKIGDVSRGSGEATPERAAGSALVTGSRLAVGPRTLPAGRTETSDASAPHAAGATQLALPSRPKCAESIEDQASSACLKASSNPTLGRLHPLSTTFNINGVNNRVGIGTTTPSSKIDIRTSGETALRTYTDSGTGAYIATASTTAPALSVEGGDSDRAAQFLGSLEVGYRLGGMFPIPVSRVFLETSANAGRIKIHNSDSVETVELVTEESSGNGAQLTLRKDNGTSTMVFDAERGSGGSELAMHNSAGTETIELLSEEAAGNGAQLVLRKANGVATMIFDAETSVASVLAMRSSNGTETVQIVAEEVAGDGAQIVLRKADGTASIVLDAQQGSNGRITTEVLEITGGADLVESFASRGGTIAPGTVVSADTEHPGGLRVSTASYDRTVLGIVSGAGDVQPGLRLGQAGVLDGDTPIALSGRVYVNASTENGPIRAGDLLTTAGLAGHAMRASDPERTSGAVLGKALSNLDETTGLVLVLVSLQ